MACTPRRRLVGRTVGAPPPPPAAPTRPPTDESLFAHDDMEEARRHHLTLPDVRQPRGRVLLVELTLSIMRVRLVVCMLS
jgi:hypothetical protein